MTSMCLSCGHTLHIRADGACLACGCAKEVLKWEEPTVLPDKPGPAPKKQKDSE